MVGGDEPTPFVSSDSPSSAGMSASGPMPSIMMTLQEATRGSVAANSVIARAMSRMKAFWPMGMRNSRCAGREGRGNMPSVGR
jgi:hypothetical protein